jgi:hypothetical protein
VIRGLALYGLSLAGFALFLAYLLIFIPGFGLGLVFLVPAPLVWGRRFTARGRRLIGRWTGVDVPASYAAEPAPPVPQADGLYRYERKLYKKPWMPAFQLRLGWVLGDRAT